MSERRIIKTSEVTPLPVTAKVLNTHSTSETDTYSCDYINNLDVNLIQGEIENGVVLWENLSPTLEFSAQTITLASDDYDYLEIIWAVNSQNLAQLSCKFEKGKATYLNWAYAGTINARDVNYISNTEISFANATVNGTTTNSTCIPIKIIGYKNTIPAVVVKEKTEMVEQIYSTEEQVIGKWIDGKPLYRKVIDFGYLGLNGVTKSMGISNGKITKIYGFAKTGTDNNYVPIPYVDPNNTSSNVAIYTIGDNLTVYSGTDRSPWYAYITIEYTKTTD